MLAERVGEDRLAAWSDALPAGTGFTVSPADERGAFRVETGGRAFDLVAGRQIVTAERLEVLAAGVLTHVDDGQDLEATLEAVRAAGSVPILPWSPGKWTGPRGAAVGRALAAAASGRLALGDVAIRSLGLPEPRWFQAARRNGIAVVAGSDPLPAAGDAKRAGRYASAAEMAWNDRAPRASLLAALANPSIIWVSAGRRDLPWQAVWRQARHMAGGRGQGSVKAAGTEGQPDNR